MNINFRRFLLITGLIVMIAPGKMMISNSTEPQVNLCFDKLDKSIIMHITRFVELDIFRFLAINQCTASMKEECKEQFKAQLKAQIKAPGSEIADQLINNLFSDRICAQNLKYRKCEGRSLIPKTRDQVKGIILGAFECAMKYANQHGGKMPAEVDMIYTLPPIIEGAPSTDEYQFSYKAKKELSDVLENETDVPESDRRRKLSHYTFEKLVKQCLDLNKESDLMDSVLQELEQCAEQKQYGYVTGYWPNLVSKNTAKVRNNNDEQIFTMTVPIPQSKEAWNDKLCIIVNC